MKAERVMRNSTGKCKRVMLVTDCGKRQESVYWILYNYDADVSGMSVAPQAGLKQ